MKKKLYAFLISFLMFSAQNSFAGETQFRLEVTNTIGDWEVVSPMYYNTTDDQSRVYAKVNATNINASNPLDHLQYFNYKWTILEHSIPSFGSHSYLTQAYTMWLDDNIPFATVWTWDIYEDVATAYSATFEVYINNTLWIDETHTSEAHTDSLEFHMWRTKSNQIVIWYKPGTRAYLKFTYGNIIFPNWSISEFYYETYTTTNFEMSFTMEYDDFSYQCGSNEGIKDPIVDENWGVFEPIRQVLLFILRIFIGLIKIILPSEMEDAFDDLLEDLGNFVTPVLGVFVWVGDNFLTIIVVVNCLLLLNGMTQAVEGEVKDVITPFITFYSTIGNISFKVINFIISIIRTLLEAIPF